MRGDVHQLSRPRDQMGHEQTGPRFAVILQSDAAELSTVIVAPTSRSALPGSFRPQVRIAGQRTAVMLDQMSAVDLGRLGPKIGVLQPEELREVAVAARRILALDLPW